MSITDTHFVHIFCSFHFLSFFLLFLLFLHITFILDCRVRHQLLATWGDCLTIIKQQAKRYLDQYLHANHADQLKHLSSAERTDILKTLRELQDMVAPSQCEGKDYAEFRDFLESWAKTAGRIEGQQRGGFNNNVILACFILCRAYPISGTLR